MKKSPTYLKFTYWENTHANTQHQQKVNPLSCMTRQRKQANKHMEQYSALLVIGGLGRKNYTTGGTVELLEID